MSKILENTLKLHILEDKIKSVLKNENLGSLERHEISSDLVNGTLFINGANGELMFDKLKSIFEATSFLKGAIVKIQKKSGNGLAERILELA